MGKNDSKESLVESHTSAASPNGLAALPGGCGPVWVKRFTLSEPFALVAALVISVNVIVMLFQADYPKLRVPQGCEVGKDGCTDVWLIINCIFLAFYVLELTLRFFTFGCAGFFWHQADWAWNLFDFVIVATGIVDLTFKIIDMMGVSGGSKGGGGKLIVIIRVLRILRVLRVLRLFRQFKKLKLLARGLLESLTSVFWIMIMIIMVLFISAIFVTNIIGQNAALWGEDEKAIRKYFGTVASSMFTLFQFITLDDWNSVDTMVTQVMPWLQAFFIPFIVLTSMVILSLLTGLMAEHMNAVAAEEEKAQELLARDDPQDLLESLAAAFNRVDVDGDLQLNRHEFSGIFTDKILAQKFEVAESQMTGREAQELFDVLDSNMDGFLSWDETRVILEDFRSGVKMNTILVTGSKLSRIHRRTLRREDVTCFAQPSQPLQPAFNKLGVIDDRLRSLNLRLGAFEDMLAQVKLLTSEPVE